MKCSCYMTSNRSYNKTSTCKLGVFYKTGIWLSWGCNIWPIWGHILRPHLWNRAQDALKWYQSMFIKQQMIPGKFRPYNWDDLTSNKFYHVAINKCERGKSYCINICYSWTILDLTELEWLFAASAHLYLLPEWRNWAPRSHFPHSFLWAKAPCRDCENACNWDGVGPSPLLRGPPYNMSSSEGIH